MRVTFLIGNGFDINCGMKCTYQDIYKGYVENRSGEPEIIRAFKDDILQKPQTWADFEEAMNLYLSRFKSEDEWATKTLKEYIQKGFVLNDEMLKNGRPFGKDYFDELLERVREIRASERRAYQKIADIFEQCSYDYDKNSETTHAFYAFVQNKLHFAVTGKTAAELIAERVSLDSPTMGLTTWKGAPDGKILKSDVLTAKNYLNEAELKRLNRLVNMFIDYAELMAEDEIPMSMQDWLDTADRFLQNNRRRILKDKGVVSREAAEKKASEIYREFRKKQDAAYESEFDRKMEQYLLGEKHNDK